MGRALRQVILAITVPAMLLRFAAVTIAADAITASPTTEVGVKFSNGKTEVRELKDGIQFFANRKFTLAKAPKYLSGLAFTYRNANTDADVALDVPAGTTIYLIVDSDKGPNRVDKGVPELNRTLTASNWKRLSDLGLDHWNGMAAVYVQTFSVARRLSIAAAPGGFSGLTIASRKLQVADAPPTVEEKPDARTAPAVHIDPPVETSGLAGEAVHINAQQATIKCLEIYETTSGLMLGETSETTLTAMRGDASRQTSVRFITPIGDDMGLARDDALRYIHLTYPNWYVDKAEITFEDKYVAHDGGSIGAAIGTMILSVIQGFAIDPNIAISGDISANGKIRAIGGVSAKLRGAIASKCTLVAIPSENFDQLVDAVTYGGLSLVTDIQVLGLSNLNDAVAAVRTDRDGKLAEAIAMFAVVQYSLEKSPAYIKTPEAAAKLARVLELAPQHLSAKILLDIAQGKQPKTLSATASLYYTSLAVRNMLTVLIERNESKDASKVPSAVLRTGLADLHKLRPMADPKVRPLIDAWVRFLQAWNDLQTGEGSANRLETQRQSLLDEMTKVNTDPQLMQKMLKEGM